MATINKRYLQDRLAEGGHLTSGQTFYIVRDFFSIISESLERGEEVKMYGFGNFKIRNKDERYGRNMYKNTHAIVSARRVVTFTASKKFVGAMSNNKSVLMERLTGISPESQTLAVTKGTKPPACRRAR